LVVPFLAIWQGLVVGLIALPVFAGVRHAFRRDGVFARHVAFTLVAMMRENGRRAVIGRWPLAGSGAFQLDLTAKGPRMDARSTGSFVGLLLEQPSQFFDQIGRIGMAVRRDGVSRGCL
jgi:hypothetical protein